VLEYADRFLDRLPTAPAFVTTTDKGRGILDAPISEEGRPIGEVLGRLADCVDRPGLNPASGGHLGYIPGGGLYTSALGDYLADVTNRYAGVFFSSPGAVYLEHQVLRWMMDLVGYPATAGGTSTSGGSIANLTALMAAREVTGLRAREVERAVVYLSTQTHHCVAKALRMIGLGECVSRQVPLDAHYRMRPDALREMVAADRAAGLRPWLLVASAGSTDVGAVDPLAALGEIAGQEGLWYHVDAAYGGFFLLTEAGRAIMAGIDRADSVVMDPHKTLFLPYGSGVVLTKDQGALLKAFRSEAPYLQDTRASTEEQSPADLSPELTRPFRGLRVWLPLMVHGVAPFRAALEEKLLLARYFRERVEGLGFLVGPEPDLSVVTYRWNPPGTSEEAADRINARIVELVREDGRVYISSTMLDGRHTLRFAAVTHRTHLATVDCLLEVLEHAARRVETELLARAPSPVVP
jgi:glutamate/tyrosine decarboxylase-like PLP-dependent enzyme